MKQKIVLLTKTLCNKDLLSIDRRIVHIPLLRVRYLNCEGSVFNFNILLFTSVNGVISYAISNADRDKTVVAVGAATANVAKKFGFVDVICPSDANAVNMCHLIRERFDARNAKILYVRGEQITLDIKSYLAEYKIDEVTGYITRENPQSIESIANCVSDYACHIFFYSQKAANFFVQQNKTGSGINAYCYSISNKIDKELARLQWLERFVTEDVKKSILNILE